MGLRKSLLFSAHRITRLDPVTPHDFPRSGGAHANTHSPWQASVITHAAACFLLPSSAGGGHCSAQLMTRPRDGRKPAAAHTHQSPRAFASSPPCSVGWAAGLTSRGFVSVNSAAFWHGKHMFFSH
jgi:hypothetical protein